MNTVEYEDIDKLIEDVSQTDDIHAAALCGILRVFMTKVNTQINANQRAMATLFGMVKELEKLVHKLPPPNCS